MGLMDSSPFGDIFGLGSWPEPPDIVPLRILGLAERPASQAEVKSAFRARLQVVHPDVVAYQAVPWLQDAADAQAADRPEVAELTWARDVLLRKIPAVTANTPDPGETSIRNGRYLCRACELPITGWRAGRPASSRAGYGNHCWRCADDAWNAAQRELRRQQRADRACAGCGETFTPPRSDGRYCSAACRQSAYRSRAAS